MKKFNKILLIILLAGFFPFFAAQKAEAIKIGIIDGAEQVSIGSSKEAQLISPLHNKSFYTLKAMNIWSRGQVVKTPPFHGGIRGSSPLEITKERNNSTLRIIFFFVFLFFLSSLFTLLKTRIIFFNKKEEIKKKS